MAKDEVKPVTPSNHAAPTCASILFHQGENFVDRGVILEAKVYPEDDKRASDVSSVLDIRKVTGGFDIDYIGTKIENRNVVNSKRTKVRRTIFFPFGTIRSALFKAD